MFKKSNLIRLVWLALALAFALYLALLPVFQQQTASETIDADATPAILAHHKKTVDLKHYAIRSGGTLYAAKDIRWTRDGEAVNSVSVPSDEREPIKLTASFDGQKKIIYVLTREDESADFVLYQSSFDEVGKADLRREGWRFIGDTSAEVSDGQLRLGDKSENYARAILPNHIGDFTGYRIEAQVSMSQARDPERWCSIAYHIENENGKFFPYYHMCVRNQTLTNTVEFTERNENDEWNLIQSLSWKLDLSSEPHTLAVSCYESTVLYEIDGEAVFYTQSADAHSKGCAGFSANYGILCLDSVRVTLLTGAPEAPLRTTKLINTAENRQDTSIKNYLSNQAYVTEETIAALFEGERYPVGILYDPQESALNSSSSYSSILYECMRRKIIPGFFVSSYEDADLLNEALQLKDAPPEVLVAGNEDVLRYARTLDPERIRGILVCDKAPESASGLCRTAASAYAQGVLLDTEYADKDYVAALQKYGLSVWVMQKTECSDADAVRLIASGANALVTSDFERIAEAQRTLFTEQNPLTRTPVWAAHRGDHTACPENSIAAFLSAAQKGADYIELDVQRTGDDEIVISHDASIDRATDGSGTIAQMTLDELRQYPLKNPDGTLSGEQIPTLNEVLDAIKDTDLFILCELKGDDPLAVKKTAQIIQNAGMEDRVVFISFTGRQLETLKENLPAVTGLLASSPETGTPGTPDAILNSYSISQSACLKQHSTLSLSHDRVGAEFVCDAADRGMTLWTWTYTKGLSGKVCSAFLFGMNAMTTDAIDYLSDAAKTLSVSAKALDLTVGQEENITVSMTNYAKKTTDATPIAQAHLSDAGQGVIEYENGVLRALGAGKADIWFSYTSMLPDGTAYTLYTQPVPVNVHS